MQSKTCAEKKSLLSYSKIFLYIAILNFHHVIKAKIIDLVNLSQKYILDAHSLSHTKLLLHAVENIRDITFDSLSI